MNELHTFLHLKNKTELKELGFYIDDIGQIRENGTNDLICGVSGRHHRHYLIPCPQIVQSVEGDLGITVYYIDKQTVKDIQHLTKINFRLLAKAGSQAFLRNMARLGLKIALEKLSEKFD